MSESTKSTEPLHLYTTKDVKEVREKLLKEQQGVCALTKLPIPKGQEVLDHNHDTQFVRAVLGRQTNALLGKIENLEHRFLSWWYEESYSTFLRAVADYLERNDDERYLHPGWLKKCVVEFNKLSEPQKGKVLHALQAKKGSNSKERKASFQEALLTRKFTFDTILNLIQLEKGIQ